MNGELAQAICLASHGSRWLTGARHSDPPDLDLENSTFQFVGSLGFHLSDGSPDQEFRAATVADWLRQLSNRQVNRLWLVIPEAKPVTGDGQSVDEHMLAGFANAGRWSLVATGGRQPELWRGTWTVGDRNAPAHRIWSVRYEGAYADQVTPQRPDLRGAASQLTTSLQAAQDFAVRQAMDPWASWFERALAASDDIPYHPDMMPSAYPREARHLAAMAAQAWVFGGMGSWNDVYVEGPAAAAEYEQVSRNLYSDVLVALVASTNDDLAADAHG